MNRIPVIARNTFREAVRDRVLYNLVVFVLLITGSAIFPGELTAGQEARTSVDFGLGAMLVFDAFISIFFGLSLVSKEIERRTIYAIFSKPIGRGEFIVGKYLGLCLTLLVNVLIMGAGVSLAILYVGGRQFGVLDLGRDIFDLSRTDNFNCRHHFIFVIFVARTVGTADVFRLYHRQFYAVTARFRRQSRFAVHQIFL